MNPKQRVMAVLNQEKPDRMPCFSANSAITYEQMDKVQAYWPEGHEKAEPMAKLGLSNYTVVGFDAVRIPFCQTFEAEALGCKIKPGKTRHGEGIPGIDHPPPYKLDDTPTLPKDFLSRGRIPELLKAVQILKKEVGDEVPVVAGIVGPFSVAGHMIEHVALLKTSYKKPEKLRPFLDVAEKAGTALAKALIDAGADIISCEDMSASTDLMAPQTYPLVMEYEKKQLEAISVPTILHICGNVDVIVESMGHTGAKILSLDPKASIKTAREKCGPNIVLMGALDTANTLFLSGPEEVKKEAERFVADGIHILAPGCSISPSTPLENLQAMVEVAKEH